MRQIVVIGARDHAAEIIAAARLSGISVRGIYDDDSQLWGQAIGEVPIKGPSSQAAHAGVPAVLAVGNPQSRQLLATQLHLNWGKVIHPKAIVDRYAHVERGCVVLEGAVIQPGVRIGAHTIIGPKATVAHDCLVGEFVHIAAGVQLAGFVQVGDGASLETGAVVIPNVTLGRASVVGPASAVIRHVADFARVIGMPAREATVPATMLAESHLEFGRVQTG
jgi:sugar O-acyltransferase (sialic acid O-acetyltransferase NeuD family)